MTKSKKVRKSTLKTHSSFRNSIPVFGLILFMLVGCKSEPPVDFAADIQPIFNKHCITCHGGVKKSGDISFLFREEALSIGKSGKAAIIPGDASGSELYRRLIHSDAELRMPYEKPALSQEEIELLKRWINEGANWGKHWAYIPPGETPVPEIGKNAKITIPPLFIQNDIDRFILAKQEKKGLTPKDLASKEIIPRRVALDLTGLPPKQEWFDAYTTGNLNYEDLVDTLLAQPSFGEKWASWWLDLARFADSKGYEKDNGRKIWTYRDWVIKALNADMPFDEFTRDQLAGDLLANPTEDQLIATAFHRNTMNNDEGGTEDEEFRIASVLDRVNTTYQVWQSTTMECVQCHSHTYDPIRHEEYYKSMAFFNNSMDEDTPDEDPVLRLFDVPEQEAILKIRNWNLTHDSTGIADQLDNFLRFNEPIYQVHHAKDFIQGELSDTKYLSLWPGGSCYYEDIYTGGNSNLYLKYRAYQDGTLMTLRKDSLQGEILTQFTVNKTNGEIIRKIPFKPLDQKFRLYFQAENPNLPEQTGTSYVTWFAFLPDIPGKDIRGYGAVEEEFLRLLNTKTATVPIVLENPDYLRRTTRVFERGNWLSPGDTVLPGTPAILNAWNDSLPKNRLGFAYWLTSAENPLTARTVVNRIWHQLFGNGLVTTLEDMGSQSEPPTHPELLDWLALRLMNENAWKLKGLIRSIVMSGTYRQSSEASTSEYAADPDNTWYARGPRQRLSAEQIRDQALAVSGLLSSKMYGPSVMPPQPYGVWQTVYSNEYWIESQGEDKHRRGLYTYIKRTSPYPSFMSFDAGSREVCTVRRTVTNTPLQALVTLNDPVYLEAAYHLGIKMKEAGDIQKGIQLGYKKAVYQDLNPDQEEILLRLYATSLENYKTYPETLEDFMSFGENPDPELAALTVVANAIMNLNAFITKS
jgi:hypothetical protein